MAIFTGDLLITKDDDGNFDINFVNGQTDMTNAFDTMVLLAAFVEPDPWYNGITDKEEEKLKSEFVKVIDRNVVTDKTKNDGVQALKKVYAFMVTLGMVNEIIVTGEIISVYAIGWQVEFIKPNNESVKYFINWEKGIIDVNGGQ